tara:strand:- start:1324 stop:1653 length:330 start_codon:yes stop_codon:yes gene_type:complete
MSKKAPPTLAQLKNMEKVKDIALRWKQHCKDNRFGRPLHPVGCNDAKQDEKYLKPEKLKKTLQKNIIKYDEKTLDRQLRNIKRDILKKEQAQKKASKKGKRRFQSELKF